MNASPATAAKEDSTEAGREEVPEENEFELQAPPSPKHPRTPNELDNVEPTPDEANETPQELQLKEVVEVQTLQATENGEELTTAEKEGLLILYFISVNLNALFRS